MNTIVDIKTISLCALYLPPSPLPVSCYTVRSSWCWYNKKRKTSEAAKKTWDFSQRGKARLATRRPIVIHSASSQGCLPQISKMCLKQSSWCKKRFHKALDVLCEKSAFWCSKGKEFVKVCTDINGLQRANPNHNDDPLGPSDFFNELSRQLLDRLPWN